MGYSRKAEKSWNSSIIGKTENGRSLLEDTFLAETTSIFLCKLSFISFLFPLPSPSRLCSREVGHFFFPRKRVAHQDSRVFLLTLVPGTDNWCTSAHLTVPLMELASISGENFRPFCF